VAHLLPVDARFGHDWAASLAIGPAWPLFLHVLAVADWKSGRGRLHLPSLTQPRGPFTKPTLYRALARLSGSNPTGEVFLGILGRAQGGTIEVQVRDLRAVQAIRDPKRQILKNETNFSHKRDDSSQKRENLSHIWENPSLLDSPETSPEDPPVDQSPVHEEPNPDAALWASALATLRDGMTAANFNTWLQDTRPVERRGAVLVVAAPTDFQRQWLQQRLRPLILRTLRVLAPDLDDVEFLTAAERTA